MSSHSPPLALPFDLSVCMADLLLFSLSLGGHLASLSGSIPGTALQENAVSCYSRSLPPWPVPLHQSNSRTHTRWIYGDTVCVYREKKANFEPEDFKSRTAIFVAGVVLIKKKKLEYALVKISTVLRVTNQLHPNQAFWIYRQHVFILCQNTHPKTIKAQKLTELNNR